MALKTFNAGAGTGNLATAGNWTPSAPAGGDDVLIGQTGYDLFGDISGVDIASLTLTPGWTGTAFGTLADPVKFQCTAGIVNLNPSARCANMHIQASGTAARVRLVSTGRGACVVSAGTFTILEGSRSGGTILIGTSPVVTTLRALSSRVRAEANGTGFTTVYIDRGGTVYTERSVATAYIDGGTLQTAKTAASSTKIWVFGGGTLNPRGSGTINEAEVSSSSFVSLADAEADPTITTVRVHAGGYVQESGPGVALQYTTFDTIGEPIG